MRGAAQSAAKLTRRTNADLIEEVLEREARLRGAMESLQEGFALFDADDRLVMINDVFRRINPNAQDHLDKHLRFEDVIRANVANGRLVEAIGREEKFIEQRLRQHRNPKGPIIRRHSNGKIYLLTETKTPDGGTVLTFTDITKLKEMERESRARARQLEMIADLGQQAVRDPDLTRLFRKATRRLAKILSVEMCKVLVLTPEGDALRLVAGVGWKRGLAGKATVGIGLDSQAGYTLQSNDAVIVEDLRTETRFDGPPLLRDHGVVSGLSVVIGDPDRPLGVLGAHTARRRTFTGDEVNTMLGVAQMLASAMDREVAAAKIEASETRLRGAIESLQEGFALFDAADRLIAFNDVYRRLNPDAGAMLTAGGTFEDGLRARVRGGKIVGAEGREEEFINERMEKHLNPGSPVLRHNSDGTTFLIQEARTPEGGIATTFIDITGLVQTQEKLEQSETRLRGAIESLREGFALFDADDRLVMINDVYRRINPLAQVGVEKGMRFEDLIRAYVKEGWIVEALGREEEFIRERIAQHRNPKGPIVRHRSDGRGYILEESRTPEGGIALTFTDITDLEIAESALRESEQQFRAFVDHSPAAIFLKDTEGRYLQINRQYEKWYGVSRGDIVGKTAYDVFPKEFAEWVSAQDRAILETGRVLEEETEAPRVDGVLRQVNTVKFPIFDSDGKIVAIGGINTDVSDRRRVERALRDSQDQDRLHLGQLSKVLRAGTVAEMAAALAHQLNQPLSAVVNYSRGLRNKLNAGRWTEDELRATLGEIVEQSDRAGIIIRDIADFIRGSEGEVSPIDINDLVIRAARFLKPELEQSRIKLDLDLSGKTPRIDAVPIEIEQAILNLAMNSVDAIKANGNGARKLTLQTAVDGEGAVRVSVIDTGTGISPEVSAQLFQPFTSTKPSGMGMGLAISRTIVEKHRGRIWAGTNGPQGAAFHFTLPAAREDSADGE